MQFVIITLSVTTYRNEAKGQKKTLSKFATIQNVIK